MMRLRTIFGILILAAILPLGLHAHGTDGPALPILNSRASLAPTPVHSGKGSVPHGAMLASRPSFDASTPQLKPWQWMPGSESQAQVSLIQIRHERRYAIALPQGRLATLQAPKHSLQSPRIASLRQSAGWPLQWPIRPPPACQSIV